MNFLSDKNTIHVEVCLSETEYRLDELIRKVDEPMREYIERNEPLPQNIALKVKEVDALFELQYVQSFLVESDGWDVKSPNRTTKYHIRYYQPNRRSMESESLDSREGDFLSASKHWILPSSTFVGQWENLIYENGLKEKLLKFALSALTLSQHNVNTNIISCNRLLLLHGPPGTGKTSLCQALAQKLAIRSQRCFQHCHLIEINSHSLFSKWYSESGKLVMRLFAKIQEIVGNPCNLVCVLIDEVESLAYARSSMGGQEPQDAMRVVNALLTQLDCIKAYRNVFILATSNLPETIDLAFLDRADIKQYIGLPGVPAIKRIYESIFLELMRINVLHHQKLEDEDDREGLLSNLAERSIGLSGRTLRKLPFLAYALYTTNEFFEPNDKITLSDFLDSMMLALEKHKQDRKDIEKKQNEDLSEME